MRYIITLYTTENNQLLTEPIDSQNLEHCIAKVNYLSLVTLPLKKILLGSKALALTNLINSLRFELFLSV